MLGPSGNEVQPLTSMKELKVPRLRPLLLVIVELSTLLLGCFYLLYMLYSNLSRVLLLVLSCRVCHCCWLTVCIVVVVLCVLLSYVYLFYNVGYAVLFFYFRCQTAG